MSLTVRPARREDVLKYYPGEGASFRAWVAEIDGVVAGIIGLVMTRPTACLISVTGDELRPHLRCMSVLRAIKRTQMICKAHGGRIIAVQDKSEPTSPAILKRLGFRPFGEVGDQFWYVFGG